VIVTQNSSAGEAARVWSKSRNIQIAAKIAPVRAGRRSQTGHRRMKIPAKQQDSAGVEIQKQLFSVRFSAISVSVYSVMQSRVI
jgi:hypothetical protein